MVLSVELSELLGMHAGDGYLRASRPEFEMSGGVEEKEYYDSHVIPLFRKLLNRHITGRWMNSKGTYGFSVFSKELSLLFQKYGFPLGYKSRIVRVPQQVLQGSKQIKLAFLRGYFDTDGCVAFSKKISAKNSFKKHLHTYPRIIFSSVSQELINDVAFLLDDFVISYSYFTHDSKIVTEGMRYKIQISGDNNCDWWFQHVKPCNPVKTTRYQVWKMYGFCPTHTTLSTRRKFLKGEEDPNDIYGLVV